ncbi:MBL fold metallo-hydrolase [Rubellimicrobium roseum]|uniref:MBL fold metallo-hydrolase n=1 Tax=Rubellimicrobium roseum TaxID=687525 RepID=A0A5C4N5R6_9RHOB|nr:MBL fold metallo-hydrolase [Rubellimicrobium roseum]TNC62551.1 MBL fold metallo-hydrolase [Rubellimicrobium roseum]
MLSKTSPSRGPGSPRVIAAYEPDSGSIEYIVVDEATKQAALIDPVLDFDPRHARTSTKSAQWALDTLKVEGLALAWILDTHPHADHLMASAWLKEQTGAPTVIGERIRDIAKLWRKIYNLDDEFESERTFDRHVSESETLRLGDLEIRVMLSPGHTLGSVTYVVDDAAFVHDTFMQPDAGTTRAGFPGGSARELYRSLQVIPAMPDDTRVFVGHDYGTEKRKEPAWEATVREHREHNKHVGGGVSEEEFVHVREARDATLDLPDRMLHALQVNFRGGRLPEPEDDGQRYLKIPVNRF